MQGAGFNPWTGNQIPHAATKDPASPSEDQRSHMPQLRPRAVKFKKKKKDTSHEDMRSKFLLLNMYVGFCISDLSDPLPELAHTNCVPLLQTLCSVASNGPWWEHSYHENQETWQTGLFHWGSQLFFIFLHTASPGSLMMLTPGILSGSLSSPRRGPRAGNQGLRLITHWATCWVSFIVSEYDEYTNIVSSIFYSPPGSSAHGLFQARILKWVAMPFSKRSSQPRGRTRSPTLQADSSLLEAPGKPSQLTVSTNFPATWESLLWVDPPGPNSVTPADTTKNKVNPFPQNCV